MTSAFSWQSSVSLCPASFCTQNKLASYSRYLLTFSFCIPIAYDEKDTFFWCWFQKVLQVSIEPFNFSFFSITHWGIDLDCCVIEWFSLEMNGDHFVVFEIASKYCILVCFIYYDGYSISSKGFLPTIVDIMFIQLNSPISVHFSLLIPKMTSVNSVG